MWPRESAHKGLHDPNITYCLLIICLIVFYCFNHILLQYKILILTKRSFLILTTVGENRWIGLLTVKEKEVQIRLYYPIMQKMLQIGQEEGIEELNSSV